MKQENRPLSPHLQVYRLPMAALMSILHRATGVVSSIGLLLVTLLLAQIAQGPEHFQWVARLIKNPLVLLILFVWSGALLYHFCNGIRHLTWDIGYGLNKMGVRKSGFVAQGATAVLLVLLWVFLLV